MKNSPTVTLATGTPIASTGIDSEAVRRGCTNRADTKLVIGRLGCA
jgi:hypothetical protein